MIIRGLALEMNLGGRNTLKSRILDHMVRMLAKNVDDMLVNDC